MKLIILLKLHISNVLVIDKFIFESVWSQGTILSIKLYIRIILTIFQLFNTCTLKINKYNFQYTSTFFNQSIVRITLKYKCLLYVIVINVRLRISSICNIKSI